MKIRIVVGTVGAAVLALTGCSSGGSSSSGGSGGSGGGDAITVAYSSPIASQPGQTVVSKGQEQATAALGWESKTYDANLSSSQQVSDVQTMILQNVGAIVIYPLNSQALGGSFAQAKAAGIPVVGISNTGDGITKTVNYAVNTCTDNAPYKQDAVRLAEQRPGGRVLVMGGPPVPTLQAGVKCFTDAAKAAGLTILDEGDNTDDTSAGAATLAADLLTKHPDVDIFWAYNDQSALGISSALQAAGKPIQHGDTKGVIVEGTNGDDDAIQAVRDGRITGTWDANQLAMGWATVKAVQEARAGNMAAITVQSTFYDSSNIDEYVAAAERKYTMDTLPLEPAS